MSPPNRQIMYWFYNHFNFHTSGSINLQGAILFGKWKSRFFWCRFLIRIVSMMRDSERGGILQPLMHRLRSSRLLFLYLSFLWEANSPIFRFLLKHSLVKWPNFPQNPHVFSILLVIFIESLFIGWKKRLYWQQIYAKYNSFEPWIAFL